MSTLAVQLAQAQLIALERLVKIVQTSDDETEARLAAAVILRFRDPDKSRTAKPPASPTESRAQPANPPAQPKPQRPESTIREATRVLNAVLAAHPPRPPGTLSPIRSAALTPEAARAP